MDIRVAPKRDTSQVTLSIRASAEEFQPYLERAARQLSKSYPVSGFRPGKAPVPAVAHALGTERLVAAAVDSAIPRLFVEAVLARNLEALGRPTSTIEAASLSGGISFTAVVDVLPEITLPDVHQLSLKQRPIQVTDLTVGRELTWLAKQHSTYVTVLRPAQKGDTVMVDFQVRHHGQPLAGGASKNHPVHLGESHFIPGFEEQLRGIRARETREFTLSLPKDIPNQALRGTQITATVTAQEVKKRVVPVINDEFARRLGRFTSLTHLKAELKKNLTAELTAQEEQRIQGALADQLAAATVFPALPQSLIEREIDRRLAELARVLATRQDSLDQHLAQQQKTPEQLRADLRPAAEKTVKVSLALRAFAKAEHIEVTDEEIEREHTTVLRHLSTAGASHHRVGDDDLKASIASSLRHQKALKRLVALAQIRLGPVPTPRTSQTQHLFS